MADSEGTEDARIESRSPEDNLTLGDEGRYEGDSDDEAAALLPSGSRGRKPSRPSRLPLRRHHAVVLGVAAFASAAVVLLIFAVVAIMAGLYPGGGNKVKQPLLEFSVGLVLSAISDISVSVRPDRIQNDTLRAMAPPISVVSDADGLLPAPPATTTARG